MSFIGDALGLNQGFDAPNLQSPVNAGDVGHSLNATRNSFESQQHFLAALAGQQGLNNQGTVFDQQQALQGQQQGLLQQQQGLAQQLQDQGNGLGPNPALAQFNQATGQNVAQQAALMAGQRGASANTGLIARQAGMQGGNIQQQAAGQAAIMQAQQQIAARQQLAQQQAAMGNQLQAIGGQQQAQQQVAANQVANQANTQQQAVQNAQSLYGSQIGAQSQNNATVGAVQGQLTQAKADQTGAIVGGLLGGAGAAAAALHDGGQINSYSSGGPVSNVGKYFHGISMKQGGNVPGQAQAQGDNSKNDTVPAMLSPKEIVLPRSITMGKNAPEKAAEFVRALLAKQGKKA